MKNNLKVWSGVVTGLASLVLLSSFLGVFSPIQLKGCRGVEPEEITPGAIFRQFDFSTEKSLLGWKNKIYTKKTRYWIDQKNGEKFLHSKSEKTASAFYRLTSYDINNYPILSWTWRPVKFPNKTGITDPEHRDDYALRFYVIFASGFFTNFRCVEYIWDESLKEGTIMKSPYSNKIMQLVVKSGPGTGEWVTHQRNVLEDYITLFGKRPNLKVRAIAVMSDSEDSQDSSEAHFKEIKIFRGI